ncbi:MAG: phosphodiesterase [Ruminococcaceae bacterium]|nr:phosphodiesterase [Oscillospiraceae bacterium]
MKLFIASDIHGSAYYTEIMLREFEASGAEKLILLGDILYHGPRNDLPADYSPKRVAEMLNKYADRIISVKGNCEAEVDSLMLDFPVTAEYGVIFDVKTVIYLSHGHRAEPKMADGTLYFTGHTHVPHDRLENGVRYLNPGSVSIPKNDSPHSAIIYDNGNVIWYDIVNKAEYTI